MYNIGVFAIILNDKKQILLSHRIDIDLWNLPGGGVEPNETPQNALVREIKEETGLEIAIDSLTALNTNPKKNELVLTFKCDAIKGEITKSDEADQHQWFSFGNIPLNIVPKQLERIFHFFKKPDRLFMKTQNQPSTKELLLEGKLENYNTQFLNKKSQLSSAHKDS